MNSASRDLAGAGAFCLAATIGLAAFALSGCVETAADLGPEAEAQHVHLVRRPDVSLAGASVAFVSVDGPPAAVSTSFMRALTREAAARDIALADGKKAHYLVRGYLSAYATKDGAAIEYVWDVFTRDKLRAQRVNDVLEVKGQGDDPWAIAGDGALSSVAAKSADDLAAFLSYTPEAVAEVKTSKVPAPPERPAADEAKPLSYAPVD